MLLQRVLLVKIIETHVGQKLCYSKIYHVTIVIRKSGRHAHS